MRTFHCRSWIMEQPRGESSYVHEDTVGDKSSDRHKASSVKPTYARIFHLPSLVEELTIGITLFVPPFILASSHFTSTPLEQISLPKTWPAHSCPRHSAYLSVSYSAGLITVDRPSFCGSHYPKTIVWHVSRSLATDKMPTPPPYSVSLRKPLRMPLTDSSVISSPGADSHPPVLPSP